MASRLFVCLVLLVATTVDTMAQIEELTNRIAGLEGELTRVREETQAILTFLNRGLEESNERIAKMEAQFTQLARQVKLQQFFVEERIRSDGASGIKQCRMVRTGDNPYDSTTATDMSRVAAIHDHGNNRYVVGMGELIAVLHGVEFRTRHNDYELVQSAVVEEGEQLIAYDAVEPLEFPDVPESVLNKPTWEEQVEEMREYFRAFQTQNSSIRNYKDYFKPVISYLEGAWTISDPNSLDESFLSDRHFLDASSWLDLQEKVLFTTYTGRKDFDENFAYLPTTILNETLPLRMAQWNYRILCQSLKDDLPTSHLVLIDDITSRMASRRTPEQHESTRAARYKLIDPSDRGDYTLVDRLMAQVPGKNGHNSTLRDHRPGRPDRSALNVKTGDVLNVAYYHRQYKQPKKDAMGNQMAFRGFSDPNLFMARTTQPKIANITLKSDKKWKPDATEAWTYAIPMEIIYLTPLYKWNPHNISYQGDFKEAVDIVTQDGRNGRSEEKALNGIHSRVFYQTPRSFFTGPVGKGDNADTAIGKLWVKNNNGTNVEVVASGLRIVLPEIAGVGTVRLRYPIMPFHYEGGAAWKELTALKDAVLHRSSHEFLYSSIPENEQTEVQTDMIELKLASPSRGTQHEHTFTVLRQDLIDLCNGTIPQITVTTEKALGHTHTLDVVVRDSRVTYSSCDEQETCFDNHPTRFAYEGSFLKRSIMKEILKINNLNSLKLLDNTVR